MNHYYFFLILPPFKVDSYILIIVIIYNLLYYANINDSNFLSLTNLASPYFTISQVLFLYKSVKN